MWIEIWLMNFQREKDKDAFRRMYAEFLIIVFNDIMPEEDYIYSVRQCLLKDSPYHRMKLDRHNESVYWLLNRAKDSVCFEVLGIKSISKKKITRAIINRFHGNRKFHKFYIDFSRECS